MEEEEEEEEEEVRRSRISTRKDTWDEEKRRGRGTATGVA